MTTSGAGALNSALYSILLIASLSASRSALTRTGTRLRVPVSCLVMWVVVASGSILSLVWAEVYRSLSRQPDKIRDGQLWRLITSVVAQDGEVTGTVFNLVSLAVLLALSGHFWGARRTALLAGCGLLAFNCASTFLSPSAGGGNSAVTFFLAASLVGMTFVRFRSPTVAAAAALSAATGAALLALLDAHGEAVLEGLLVGALLAEYHWNAANRAGRRGERLQPPTN